MFVKKDSEYQSLPSLDKMLALSGIPVRYLKRKLNPSQFIFGQTSHTFGDRLAIVAPDRQLDYFNKLQADIASMGTGGVIAVGSWSQDAPGYEFLTHLCRSYYIALQQQKRMAQIRWIDVGTPDWSYLREQQENDIVVLHGINDNSTPERVERLNDFLRYTDTATKVLLITTSNILEFMASRLKTLPDAAFQLQKATRVVM